MNKLKIKKSKYFFLIYFFYSFFIAHGQTSEEIISEAGSLFDSKKYSEAVVLYEKYLQQNPKEDYYLNQAGLCYYNLGNFIKAKEKFRLASLYAENNATYYSNLSSTFLQLNDNEKAYAYAQKAFSIEETPLTLWNAASNSINNHKYEESLRIINNATIPITYDYYSLYGYNYLLLQQYKKSIENYELFFAQYNKETAYADFNIDDEKNNLFRAYISELLDEKNNFEYNRQKIIELYLELINKEKKEKKPFNG